MSLSQSALKQWTQKTIEKSINLSQQLACLRRQMSISSLFIFWLFWQHGRDWAARVLRSGNRLLELPQLDLTFSRPNTTTFKRRLLVGLGFQCQLAITALPAAWSWDFTSVRPFVRFMLQEGGKLEQPRKTSAWKLWSLLIQTPKHCFSFDRKRQVDILYVFWRFYKLVVADWGREEKREKRQFNSWNEQRQASMQNGNIILISD